jgi:hypothetical protein
MWRYSQEPAQRGQYPPTLQVLASLLSLTVQISSVTNERVYWILVNSTSSSTICWTLVPPIAIWLPCGNDKQVLSECSHRVDNVCQLVLLIAIKDGKQTQLRYSHWIRPTENSDSLGVATVSSAVPDFSSVYICGLGTEGTADRSLPVLISECPHSR